MWESFALWAHSVAKPRLQELKWRRDLVDLARATTRRWKIPRIKYVWSDMSQMDWAEFHGIYLYNPFYLNIVEVDIRIDEKIEFSSQLFERYIACVEAKLELSLGNARDQLLTVLEGKFLLPFKRKHCQIPNFRTSNDGSNCD